MLRKIPDNSLYAREGEQETDRKETCDADITDCNMVSAKHPAMKTHRGASSVTQRTAVLKERAIADHATDHSGIWEDRTRREDVVDKAREEMRRMTLTSSMIADDMSDVDEVDRTN